MTRKPTWSNSSGCMAMSACFIPAVENVFQIDATRKPRYEAMLRNGTLTSRIMALILGLTVGVSQTKADVIIDNFTGTNSPATSGTPPVLFTTGPGLGRRLCVR